MAVSVSNAVEDAFAWMHRLLFKTLDVKGWLVLWFCSFLAGLARSPGQFSSSGQFSGGEPSKLPWNEVGQWVTVHLTMVIFVGVILFVVSIAIWMVMLWLGSKGTFMLLDGIVNGRAAVKKPWHAYRAISNSLFGARVVLWVAGAVGLIVIAGLGVLLALPDINAAHFGDRALVGAVTAGVLLFLFIVAFSIVNALLMDFVTLVMYRHDMRVMPAVRFFLDHALKGRVFSYIVFYLLKIALSMLAGIAVTLATCVTCCLAALPYIHSVVFLPVTVFFKAYAIYFLGQQGDELQVMNIADTDSADADREPSADSGQLPA